MFLLYKYLKITFNLVFRKKIKLSLFMFKTSKYIYSGWIGKTSFKHKHDFWYFLSENKILGSSFYMDFFTFVQNKTKNEVYFVAVHCELLCSFGHSNCVNIIS